MRISDWSSDVCSSDLVAEIVLGAQRRLVRPRIAEIAIGEAVEGIAADMAGLARDRRDVAQRRRVHRHALGRVAERVEIRDAAIGRSEEHTSELQSLMRISDAVFCLHKQKNITDAYLDISE